jgi:hypothetical protein
VLKITKKNIVAPKATHPEISAHTHRAFYHFVRKETEVGGRRDIFMFLG